MKSKLLVIMGPTSTGKTDLGIEIAKNINGEIISADSRQVYKYLDLGTGKLPSNVSSIKYQVSREKGYWVMDGIKVWMYDISDPDNGFNLYQYIIKAQEVIKKIISEGKLPVIVGGTGFYIRSLLEGFLDFGIDENSDLRQELEELNINEIRDRINLIAPEVLPSLNNSEFNNKRRLIRVLEKLLSKGQNKTPFPGIEKDFNVLKIGLTADKEVLSRRIKDRVVKRIKQGMIEEAEELIKQKRLDFKRMDELGLEYRYLAKLLSGEIKTESEFIEILSLKIKQFAKRQQTWFKKEKDVTWFDTDTKDFMKKVEMQVLDWYNYP